MNQFFPPGSISNRIAFLKNDADAFNEAILLEPSLEPLPSGKLTWDAVPEFNRKKLSAASRRIITKPVEDTQGLQNHKQITEVLSYVDGRRAEFAGSTANPGKKRSADQTEYAKQAPVSKKPQTSGERMLGAVHAMAKNLKASSAGPSTPIAMAPLRVELDNTAKKMEQFNLISALLDKQQSCKVVMNFQFKTMFSRNFVKTQSGFQIIILNIFIPHLLSLELSQG